MYAGTRAGRLKTTVPAREDRGRYRKVPLPLSPSSFPDGDASVPDQAPANSKHYDALEKTALTTVYQRRIRGSAQPGSSGGLALPLPAREGPAGPDPGDLPSDNGFAIGPHNLNGKLYHYDESVRIPVYLRGPGLPRGVSVPTAMTNPDLAATILAAAGVDSPRPLDGVDILPWIGAPAQVRVVPIEAWGLRTRRQIYQGIRVGAWTWTSRTAMAARSSHRPHPRPVRDPQPRRRPGVRRRPCRALVAH